MKSAISSFFQFFRDTYDRIRDFLETLSEYISWIAGMIGSIFDKIQQWFEIMTDTLQTWFDSIPYVLDGFGVDDVLLMLCISATVLWIITRIGGKE